MVIHRCTKEGEISMMVEQIKNLKATTDRIEDKLDKFIDTADAKYATKQELNLLRIDNDKQDKEISWTREKIIDLTVKVANILIILGLGTKALGVW